jgi:hypothetical protein
METRITLGAIALINKLHYVSNHGGMLRHKELTNRVKIT